MKDCVRLIVLRHAESRGNVGLELDMDPALTPRGIEQARVLGRWLEGVVFDGAFISPLLRTRQTFEEAGLKARAVIFDSRLVEARDRGMYAQHCLPYPATPRYGNPDRHDAWERPFSERVREFMADAAGLPAGLYLAVCHGGTAHGLANDLVRKPEEKQSDALAAPVATLDNAAWGEFILTGDRRGDRLVRWNALAWTPWMSSGWEGSGREPTMARPLW